MKLFKTKNMKKISLFLFLTVLFAFSACNSSDEVVTNESKSLINTKDVGNPDEFLNIKYNTQEARVFRLPKTIKLLKRAFVNNFIYLQTTVRLSGLTTEQRKAIKDGKIAYYIKIYKLDGYDQVFSAKSATIKPTITKDYVDLPITVGVNGHITKNKVIELIGKEIKDGKEVGDVATKMWIVDSEAYKDHRFVF